MPDRIIRDELLESERWLSLKDNADRLAYVALLLKADSLGNFTGEPYRLMRLWRDFGINTLALVSKSLTELVDHDLVRIYEHEGQRLIHIPRFNQRMRYVKRVFPLSPWTTAEQLQRLEKESPGAHPALTGLAPQKEVKEVKERKNKALDLDLNHPTPEKRKKPVDKIPDQNLDEAKAEHNRELLIDLASGRITDEEYRARYRK